MACPVRRVPGRRSLKGARDDIQAGEWFVKYEEPGIVQERRSDEDALLHAFGIREIGEYLQGSRDKSLSNLFAFYVR